MAWSDIHQKGKTESDQGNATEHPDLDESMLIATFIAFAPSNMSWTLGFVPLRVFLPVRASMQHGACPFRVVQDRQGRTLLVEHTNLAESEQTAVGDLGDHHYLVLTTSLLCLVLTGESLTNRRFDHGIQPTSLDS